MNIACYTRSDTVSDRIQAALKQAGFECERLLPDLSLLRSIRRQTYDLILIEVSEQMHERDSIFSWMSCRFGESTPVIMMANIPCAELAALALDSGADDFISMPAESIELVARVHAVLRRTSRRNIRRKIELCGFTIDHDARTFAYQGNAIELTPREFTMAWLFFSKPGVYTSRETIGNAIWGVDSEIAGRTIEQHVYKLRKKLQLGPERGLIIRTAYSQGYRLELCGTNYS